MQSRISNLESHAFPTRMRAPRQPELVLICLSRFGNFKIQTSHAQHQASVDPTMSSVHAEPPPPIVTEPSGINYATGSALGKGGFAICYRAERYDGSKPTGQLVALKIVKTKMEPAKLAQKVQMPHQLTYGMAAADDVGSSSPNSKSTPNSPTQISSPSTAPSPFNPAHTWYSNSARTVRWPTCSRNANTSLYPRFDDS